MSISGISVTSASSQTSASSSATALKALVEQLNAQSSKSSDTVTISVEALQALLQSQQQDQGGGPPPMTDEMAAKMGADIQEQNSELFTQLDTDEDGVLSADEAEAGKDAIDQAIQDGTLQPPEKPEGAGGPGGPPPPPSDSASSSSSEDIIAQLISILSKQGLSDAEVAKQLGTTEAKVQEVLQAS